MIRESVHIPEGLFLTNVEFDPVLMLALMATNPDLEDRDRIACLKEVASYIHPKRRPVDGEGDDSDKVRFRLEVLSEENDRD